MINHKVVSIKSANWEADDRRDAGAGKQCEANQCTIASFYLGIRFKGVNAHFEVSKEKVSKEIRENAEKVTKTKVEKLINIEKRILEYLQFKFGAEAKKEINLILADPIRPIHYKPDAIMHTDDSLIFVEVKYIKNQAAADRIIPNTIKQVQSMMDSFQHSASKQLCGYIVVASPNNISTDGFGYSNQITLESHRIKSDDL